MNFSTYLAQFKKNLSRRSLYVVKRTSYISFYLFDFKCWFLLNELSLRHIIVEVLTVTYWLSIEPKVSPSSTWIHPWYNKTTCSLIIPWIHPRIGPGLANSRSRVFIDPKLTAYWPWIYPELTPVSHDSHLYLTPVSRLPRLFLTQISPRTKIKQKTINH